MDDTKIEANANRQTFVWGKSIKTNKERIRKQIKELWFYVEKIYAEEQMLPNQANFEEIDPEKQHKPFIPSMKN